MDKAIADLKLSILSVTVEYVERQATLPPHHKDPFVRTNDFLVLVEGIHIVSVDMVFENFSVTRIW
jgi:PIN domain nuclease of toxin-antitoxin system